MKNTYISLYVFIRDQMGYLVNMKKPKAVYSSHSQKEQTWYVHACSGMLSKSWGS